MKIELKENKSMKFLLDLALDKIAIKDKKIKELKECNNNLSTKLSYAIKDKDDYRKLVSSLAKENSKLKELNKNNKTRIEDLENEKNGINMASDYFEFTHKEELKINQILKDSIREKEEEIERLGKTIKKIEFKHRLLRLKSITPISEK